MSRERSRSFAFTARRPALSRRAACVVLSMVVAGIVWGVWPMVRRIRAPRGKTPVRSLRARDVYADSPYQNAAPGGRRMSETRPAPAATARSPMPTARTRWADRSRRSGTQEGPPTTAAAGLPFESQGVQYTVERRDGRMFHKATRRDADGKRARRDRSRGPLRSRLGDARHHLPDRARWFPLPVADRVVRADRVAGISPPATGSSPRTPNFERPIQPECLFCHTNQFRPVAGTLNRYEPPIFEGHAIGCERCHGPARCT